MAEKYPGLSPYNYCKDDPMCRIDPDGMADYKYYIDGIPVDEETFHYLSHGRKNRQQSNDEKKMKIKLLA